MNINHATSVRRFGSLRGWIGSFIIATAVLWMLCSTANCRTVDLKVYNLKDTSTQDIADKVERGVIQRFKQLHPEIRLKKGTGLSIAGGTNTQDIAPLMQIAGDVSPDVLRVNFRMSDTYVQRGFLKPLDQYIALIPEEELARRVPPAIKPVCYREGPDGKMHWYMLPRGKGVRVLMYRRDLFAKAGLDPNRPPRTWSEFWKYAKKLSDPSSGKYGVNFTKGDVSSWDFVNLIWSRGGDVIVRDKQGNWHPTFNTPEVVDALYFYVRMNCSRWKARDGKVYRGVAQRDVLNDPMSDIMKPGDPFAMTFDYLGDQVNVYRPELLGYAPIPYPEHRGRSASEVNSGMLGIYSQVKDPAVAQAAFDYISYVESDEANRIRVKIYVQNGYGRFVNPELLERFGYKDYLKQVDTEWVKVYKDAMIDGKPEPYGKNCTVVYRELSRPIEQALNDGSVLAALDRGDEQLVKKRLKAILDKAQFETSKRMFGILPPKVARVRQATTLAFLVVTALGFSFAAFSLFRFFGRTAPPQSPGQKKRFLAYLLLFPAVASVVVWQYYPLIKGTIMAFQDYNVIGQCPFVGVENFSTVLFDGNFWHSVYVTVVYTALYMGSGFIAPIFLALLLSEIPRGKVLFRTMFYLPTVVSGLVMIFLWKSFYKPMGLLNVLLGYAGIHLNVSWLDRPSLAMLAVLMPVVWAGMGPGSLIYLAALKIVPEEFYEAAEVDGAGVIKKVTRITLPCLKMLIMINAVGALIGAFMSSEMIFAMTGGGPYTPYGATEVVGLQLFYTGFMYLKFGLANAMAWVLGFMLIGFTMMQLKSLSRVEFKGGR